MKGQVRMLVLRLAVPLTLVAVAPAQAATKISQFGYVITAPGTYQVTADLSGSGNAITVLASQVNLDLNGHTLSGDGSGAGVFVQGQANVSIDSGNVQGFLFGVLFGATVDCKITHVTARQNGDSGIRSDGGTLGLTVTGCTVTQNNGSHGILLADCRANSVTHNAANGNRGNGITLCGGCGTFANSVTDNTADDNSGSGISLDSTSGNTVDRNTTERNGSYGILLLDNSSGNTVARNSVTANGRDGIALGGGSARNTIQNNTLTGNNLGIALGDGGTSANTVQGNTATLNNLGIWIGNGAGGNTLQGNTALNNGAWDLEDDNPGCDADAWSNNTFVTDLVAGVPDGGPGAGCIR